MNTRIAKKILCQITDPYRKPAETLPYTDQQFVEAGRVYWRALHRALVPGADRATVPFKWSMSPASVPHRKRDGWRRIARYARKLGTAPTDSAFAGFYARAEPFIGTANDALEAISLRGAIWHEPATDRALIADGTTRRRFAPGGGPAAVIRSYLATGALMADGMLEQGVHIYVPTRRPWIALG